MMGTKLGPYELLEEVGKGGMATVYRAYQASVDRQVAVKVIHKAIASDEVALERFRREARLIARLEHPHILPIYDFDGAHDPPYIVMRYMDSGTLKDVLVNRRLPFGEVSYLLQQVAAALDYAHKQGIVHRDVKPSNIMLDREGNAFVSDLGIARLAAWQSEAPGGLTQSGATIGTPDYMPPEQVMGQVQVDHHADLYSLAVMAFQMLTGALPYQGQSAMQILMKHVQDSVPTATQANPDLPPAIDDVFFKALAKEPVARYHSALEMVAALIEALGGAVVTIPINLRAAVHEAPRNSPRSGPTVGQTTHSTEQNKIVTALYVNAAEYAGLVEDPAMMRAFWEQASATIVAFDGHTLSQTETDLLAVWGVESVHEDDAYHAVQAALRLHDLVRALWRGPQDESLPIGLGIHTGPALLTPSEQGLAAHVSGQTVSVAHRLADRAEGEIWMSHATQRVAPNRFEVTTVAPLPMRGRAEPLVVYRVEGTRSHTYLNLREVEGVVVKLVGREVEMKRLQNAYFAALEDHEAQALLVTGAAGLGKSRLLLELSEWAKTRAEQQLVLWGRASAELRQRPYALFGNLVAFNFNILASDPSPVVLDKLERGVAQLAEGGGAAGQVSAGISTRDAAHLMGYLAGFDLGPTVNVQRLSSDPVQLVRLARLTVTRVAGLSLRQQALIFFIEDLHHADDASLELLAEVFQAHPRAPLLLVGVGRQSPEKFRAALPMGVGATLEVAPLTRRDARNLVREILQKLPEIPKALSEAIVERAEGNPLYIEEQIRMLLEDRILQKGPTAEEAWTVQLDRLNAWEHSVPPTLAGLLQARLDSLLPLERVMMQRATVIGRVFWDQAVAALSQADTASTTEPQRLLEGLVERGLLQRHPHSAFAQCTEYAFGQTMLREAVYATLTQRQRRAYHAGVAEWLSHASYDRGDEYAARIAEHYAGAEQAELAAAYFTRAGRQALRLSSYAEAKSFLERAARHLENSPAPALVLVENMLLLAQAYHGLNEMAREKDLLDASHALAVAQAYPLGVAESLLGLGRWERARGNYAQAEAYLTQSQTHFQTLQAERGSAQALMELSYIARAQGDYAAEHQRIQAAQQIYQQQADTEGQAYCLQELGINARNRGDYAAAQQWLEEALQISRAHHHRYYQAYTLNMLGYMHGVLQNYLPAAQMLEASIAIFREVGNQWGVASGLNQLGYVLYFQGDGPAANAAFDESLTLCQTINDRWGAAVCYNGLGWTALAQARPEAARAHFQQGLRAAQAIPVLQVMTEAVAGLAACQVRADQSATALPLFGLTLPHPASKQDLHVLTAPYLQTLRATLGEAAVEAGLAHGVALDFDAVVAELITTSPNTTP